MAKVTEITVDVKFNIPDETVCRCLRVLEMWMDDHQDKDIVCDLIPYENGFKHEIYIEDASQDDDGDDIDGECE